MARFECEFVKKPPKALQCECPICLLVLREPYQTTCCGKSFCKECIDQIIATNGTCPTCNDNNFNMFYNKGLQQSLNDFEVYCSHKREGCEWRGELRELDNHLDSDSPADKSLEGCPFTVIQCPLGCVSCKRGVCRKDVKAHVNDKLLSNVMAQTAQMKSFEQKLHANDKLLSHVTARMKSFEQKLQEIDGVNARRSAQLQEVLCTNKQTEQCVSEIYENHATQTDQMQSFKQQVLGINTQLAAQLDEVLLANTQLQKDKQHIEQRVTEFHVTQSAQMKSFKQQLQEICGFNTQLSAQLQEVLHANTQLQKDNKDLEERVTELELYKPRWPRR